MQKTLSTTSSAPAALATAASAAISETSVSGFDGVSRNSILVLGRSARRHSSTRVGETKEVSTPNRARMVPNSCTVAPNTALEQTIWSPLFSSAMAVARIADMPEAVAMQDSAPSSAARRSWNIATVGLVKRE